MRMTNDILSGVLFTALGLITVGLSTRLHFGTLFQMGPGFFPVVLGGMLTLLGVVIFARALPEKGTPVESFSLRPLLILVAAVLFAEALPRIGFLASSFLLVAVSFAARRGFRWGEVLIVGLALTILSYAVLIYSFNLPVKLWPL